MCLNVDISISSTLLNVLVKQYYSLIPIKSIKVLPISSKLKVHYNILCSVSNEKYLHVTPNIIWLTPDMLGEEFDIYSNVSWRIDAKDIDNGGDEPTILSMLDNSTYLHNEYYLKNGI